MITRHGKPVVELKPIPPVAHAVSAADLDWLAEHRITKISAENAGSVVSKLSDEEAR